MLKQIALKVRNWLIAFAFGILTMLGVNIVANADDNNLSWEHDGQNVEGFYVYHRVDGSQYNRIATITDATVRGYLHADQEAGRHCYEVSAFNTAGESTRSNEACKTVLGVPGNPFNLGVN